LFLLFLARHTETGKGKRFQAAGGNTFAAYFTGTVTAFIQPLEGMVNLLNGVGLDRTDLEGGVLVRVHDGHVRGVCR